MIITINYKIKHILLLTFFELDPFLRVVVCFSFGAAGLRLCLLGAAEVVVITLLTIFWPGLVTLTWFDHICDFRKRKRIFKIFLFCKTKARWKLDDIKVGCVGIAGQIYVKVSLLDYCIIFKIWDLTNKNWQILSGPDMLQPNREKEMMKIYCVGSGARSI